MKITKRLIRDFRRITSALKPPTSMNLSEWADSNRVLRTTTSAEPGRWRTSRFPFNKEIMDCLSVNSPVTDIAYMKAAQVGATDSVTCWLGYIIDQEPGPIMAVQPTVDLVKRYSRQRVTPSFEDAECLQGKVKEPRSRDSGNTILSKEFPGGILLLAGANSAAGLRSASVRYLMLDEIDAYPDDVEGEGDPCALAAARTRNFKRRKIIKLSTPTVAGASRIESDFEDSDQRKYFVPCPQCEHKHALSWENFIIPKDDNNRHQPQEAHMLCPHCGFIINEHHKTKMLAAGEWIPTNLDWKDRSKRGYHINALYSPVGFYSWEEAAKEWLAAQKDVKKLKTFVNTVLGETWEEDQGGESVDETTLVSHKIEYGLHENGSLVIPDEVLLLTAAVDVQDSWLEYEVVGWGCGYKSFGIETRQLIGNPQQAVVWEELDEILQRVWIAQDGTKLPISCTCIDSGGHCTQEVYKFVKSREHRRVFAIKGRGGLGVQLVGKPTRTNRMGVALFGVGDDTGKETVLNRLKIDDPSNNGYCTFPAEASAGYDEAFFKGITSEKRVIKYRLGRPQLTWVLKPGAKRNEALDIRKYATAALEILNPNFEVIQQYRSQQKIVDAQSQKRRRSGIISRGVQ